jgi:hypothetical protein
MNECSGTKLHFHVKVTFETTVASEKKPNIEHVSQEAVTTDATNVLQLREYTFHC